MKINPNFSAFSISSKGMSIQKKQIDLITENIANTSTTKTEDGTAYKRKYISVEFEKDSYQLNNPFGNMNIGFQNTNSKHIAPVNFAKEADAKNVNFDLKENIDNSKGDLA